MPPLNPQIQSFFKSAWPSKLASALILMLMGWWAFANVLPMFGEKKEISAPVTIANKAKAPKKSSLNTLNLFGNAEKSSAMNKTSEAKQTKLSLTLRGILATDDPKQGIAQIQNAKKQERHFAVSDSVFGQATLEEIHADHVILLHNGRYETLLLPEKFLNVKHFSAEQHALEKKKIATDYRQLFLSRNANKLRKLFGFDTAWKNGGFAGFIIKALSDKGREMMAKLGVEDGDLITVVNGLRFSESLEASQQLTELKTATSVDVIIERNGEEFPLHFDFDAPITDKISVGSSNSINTNNQNQNPNINHSRRGTNTFNTSNNTAAANTNTNADTANTNNTDNTSTLPFSGSSVEEDEDLGEDWDDKAEAQEFQAKQEERRTTNTAPVEYDH